MSKILISSTKKDLLLPSKTLSVFIPSLENVENGDMKIGTGHIFFKFFLNKILGLIWDIILTEANPEA